MPTGEAHYFIPCATTASTNPGRELAVCFNGLRLRFPEDAHKNNGILVFVDRFSKMYHLAAVNESILAHGCARVFIDTVFRLHGLPRELVSDRYPRFTTTFWQPVFRSLGTRLTMSTSDHPETDGQTERVNRVLEEILRGYVQSHTDWSEFLPMVEFAINDVVHASTTHATFFVNGLSHPRLLTHLECDTNSRGRNLLEQQPFWILLITCRDNRRRKCYRCRSN